MNINVIDINKMALNIEKMNAKLEQLIKQLEKNKIKYPIGLTYDQQYEKIISSVEKGIAEQIRIVKIS